MRRHREDIQLAANIAAIALALFTLAAWALSWPSTVIATVLLVVGVAAVLTGRSVETTTGLAHVPAWARLPMLASRLFISALVVIAMLALPLLTMTIGALVLLSLLFYGLVQLVPRAQARYRPTPSTPGRRPKVTPPAPGRRRTPRHDVRRRVGR